MAIAVALTYSDERVRTQRGTDADQHDVRTDDTPVDALEKRRDDAVPAGPPLDDLGDGDDAEHEHGRADDHEPSV